MTRDEHRTQCIAAMENAYIRNLGKSPVLREYLTILLDSLSTAGVRVVPVEATEEMERAGYQAATYDDLDAGRYKYIFAAMAARGDLTNPQEKKP